MKQIPRLMRGNEGSLSWQRIVALLFAAALIACRGSNDLASLSAQGSGSSTVGSKQPARVVFSSFRKLDGTDEPMDEPTSNIWQVNADGTGLVPLTTATADRVYSTGPRWSPDGTQLVFVSSRKPDGTDAANETGVLNIWQVNADGTGLRPLTHSTAFLADSLNPEWSPDGSQIVFESSLALDGTNAPNAHHTFNIWKMNADGSGMTPLTNATARGADNRWPQWSPDAVRVAFASPRKLDGSEELSMNNVFNIWRMKADGTGLKPLTDTTAVGTSSIRPQWSPDGGRLIFDSTRKLDGTDEPNPNPTSNIWKVNVDGTGLAPLTTVTALAANSHLGQWSPDGSQVVFDSTRKLDGTDEAGPHFSSNVWKVNADGTGLTPLTHLTAGRANSLVPQSSPDGSQLVFQSSGRLDGTDAPNANETYNIWRVNADGTGLKPVTNVTAARAHSGAASFRP